MFEEKTKVGIYTRVSTEQQINNGRSLEWQRNELLKYAKEHNLEVVQIYEERGISGEKIETRPKLRKMLKDIKAKKINHVLVYKIDRLGRRVMTNCNICEILKENDCYLTAYDCGTIDFNTACGQFLYNVLSSQSQLEVDNLSERVRKGKKQRVKDGYYLNSNNVYGYNHYRPRYKKEFLLEVNENEKIIVNRIYKMYLDGLAMDKIAKQLNMEQVPTKRGGIWRQSTIRSILTNRLYIGKVVYFGKNESETIIANGRHAPIIDEDTFIKVQKMIDTKEKFKAKKFPNEYSYFVPYMVCSKCGSKFKAKQTKSHDKESIRYYCTNKCCDVKGISHKELEQLFINKIEKVNLSYDEDVINDLDNSCEVKRYLNLINKSENKIKEFQNCLNEGIMSLEDYKIQIELSKQKITEYETKIKEIKDTEFVLDENNINSVKGLITNLKDNWIKLDNNDKQNFVNIFIDKIKVDNDKYPRITYLKWRYESNNLN